MKITYSILCMLFVLCNTICAQKTDTTSIEHLFLEQISYYPQEKIHVHTDRSTYMSGEIIWFRIHLVDALLLKQANASRYVYMELINPVDHIVERVKIRPDSTGCFYGHIQLDEELAEGNYSLRAYTRLMQNQGEDYFFHKSIYVASPVPETISPVIKFSVGKNKVEAAIYFLSKTDKKVVLPEKCLLFPDGNLQEEGQSLSFEDDMAHHSFKTEKSKKNAFILRTTFEGRVHSRFFHIPCLDKIFDVAFFPEGGHAPLSADIKMAFKAINADGLSEEIKGQVFDDLGQGYTTFESQHLGMGYFRMYYSRGRKYHAICTDKNGVSKRFDLPDASDNAVSLKIISGNNKVHVSLAQSPNHVLPSQTQLIAHIRGAVIYAQSWNEEQSYLTFDRDFFPDGIVHFLLIDKDRNILSERLVFSSQGSSFAGTGITLDKKNYQPREKINMTIQLMDENRIPLSGNFSLAVVDKKDVSIDTTSTIISTLLLSSELKGYIESPMSYLQKDDRKSVLALDVLMMTQGWRRYDIPNVLKGNLIRDLQYPVESGGEITGKAEGLFSALKEGGISLLALNDSVIGTAFTEPDKKGMFSFKNLEYPEGAKYIIQALTQKGSQKVFLKIDPIQPFPDVTIPGAITNEEKFPVTETYQSKMNQKYKVEDGIRNYNLAEIEITARRITKPKTESPYYSASSSMVLTAEDIDRWKLLSVFDLLRRIPGVTVIGEEVRYRNGIPMLLLDNIPEENFDYNLLNVNDINDAFVSPSTSVMPIFGSRAAGGAIVINTKRGFVPKNKLSDNIQVVIPIGYQQTVEFYSPAYPTDKEKNNMNPDLRSTIYWNPNIQIDGSGTVNVSFYAADAITQYGIVIEGTSSLGHLVHSSKEEILVPAANRD